MTTTGSIRSRTSAVFRRFRASQAGGVARDAFYVGIWQGATAVADFAQIALITHALGLREYGRFALVVAFVTLVGQFFDVRVGVAAVTIGARKVAQDFSEAAGLFQYTYLIDLLTGVIGFAVVAGLAPVVGPHLIGAGGARLLILFALTLLAETVDASSLSILRLLERFRLVASYTVVLEMTRVTLVVGALAIYHSLTAVVLALLVAKSIAAVVRITAAAAAFRDVSGGVPLFRWAVRALPRAERRELLKMVFHTNIWGYGRLGQVQLPTILLGAISGPTETGIYKVGMAAASMLGKVGDFTSVAITPRLARLWVSHKRAEIARLIRQVTLFSVPAMIVGLGALVLLRQPILHLLGGGAAADAASTVFILGAVGQGIYLGVFWNNNLLFAAYRAKVVSIVIVIAAILQLGLVLALVPQLGANGAAIAFLISQVVMNAGLTIMARRTLRTEYVSTGGAAVPERPPLSETY